MAVSSMGLDVSSESGSGRIPSIARCGSSWSTDWCLPESAAKAVQVSGFVLGMSVTSKVSLSKSGSLGSRSSMFLSQ